VARSFPPLLEGEQILLHQQGVYLSTRSQRFGHLSLTNKRLPFCQVRRAILNLALRSIVAAAFQKSRFILAAKEHLRLSYRAGLSGAIREAIFITADLDICSVRSLDF
jgi:hypothetical protein